LDCDPAALQTIKFFAENRRSFARVVLGRSALYFEMFEEKLAQYGLPMELKYLSVIESGLRPQVKSRAGALGLWQFMYRTGLYYGLEENSYIDERMDPEKATDAACRYLKKLHDIYGDWNLALASYNAGPGNVNKAIRRSGGKKTYWEVRPYLPKETQGYVPNFIAAAYLLTYHAEHNIIPMEAKWNYGQLDTICLSKGVHMETISKLTSWELAEIQELNPIYKKSYIPLTNPKQCIKGPLMEIGKIASMEKELFALEDELYSPKPEPEVDSVAVDTTTEQVAGIKVSGETQKQQVKVEKVEPVVVYKYHTVRRGEGLGIIAAKYGTTVNEIMAVNNMKSTVLYTGQALKIPEKVLVNGQELSPEEAKKVIAATPQQAATTTPGKPAAPKAVVPAKKFYIVKRGETATKIAQRHNLTQQQLQELNPGANLERIYVGQKLRVK
jgi:membrane-bound lytic murein transglycosylase D